MSRRRSSPAKGTGPETRSAPDITSSDPIERIAFLLGPAAGSAVFVPADDRWRAPSRADSPSLLWGRSALPSGTAPVRAARTALAREVALARTSRRRAQVHRMAPQILSGGRVRNGVRRFLLGGAIVGFPAAGNERRVVDEAAAAAGVTLDPAAPLHLSSSGAVLVRVRAGNADALLRVGVAGAPGDPSSGATALAHLSALELPVPRLLRTGAAAGSSWALETLLPGRRPRGTSPDLARRVADVLAILPAGIGPPGAPRRDLDALASLLPERADPLRALANQIRAELRPLPSIMRHGDLWSGNLLAVGGRLTGIVDWDAWDPGAVPGADLLHLYAAGRRIAERRHLGQLWGDRPWKDDAYRSLLTGPSASIRDEVLSIAWWAGEVRGTVARHPARAEDEAWLQINVDAVLRTLRP